MIFILVGRARYAKTQLSSCTVLCIMFQFNSETYDPELEVSSEGQHVKLPTIDCHIYDYDCTSKIKWVYSRT
jgi:hypothetical protein